MNCAECGVKAYKTHRCHGTRGAYRRGCRCDLCREANALGQRRYRGPTAGPTAGPATTLESLCWCGRRTLTVTAADVRAGITKSCGRTGCEAQAVSV